MFSYKFKAEKQYFQFKLKRDPSNTTYCNTEMSLHKVHNQRSYEKSLMILHHGNPHIMHICLYISKSCLEDHILSYDQYRLSSYTCQTAYDHSIYHELLYVIYDLWLLSRVPTTVDTLYSVIREHEDVYRISEN